MLSYVERTLLQVCWMFLNKRYMYMYVFSLIWLPEFFRSQAFPGRLAVPRIISPLNYRHFLNEVAKRCYRQCHLVISSPRNIFRASSHSNLELRIATAHPHLCDIRWFSRVCKWGDENKIKRHTTTGSLLGLEKEVIERVKVDITSCRGSWQKRCPLPSVIFSV